ncbi:hypothetical protein Pmar_PMAR007217 [Perkinsus marinus ATCC 50983]|uniref:Uncharacterized protein n=1 Tax=Perkinsus marinus (strain ATCC 50983 / TXsc) TaxID=423536 RepID=C5LWP2_PERM5|nr:hypothetical protein Pmar_PMAR007217 [Perkinsus marinus ATCC 50983]EEQ98838.1 hypothetical protein Pmar_PMAR007217 [Perkinsus marinus ATCC 50983]|eukprot:XP_002766121.1 hypothetical protein Pmar_PMAR007217 [Perkinsus marinus ATCC 50983]
MFSFTLLISSFIALGSVEIPEQFYNESMGKGQDISEGIISNDMDGLVGNTNLPYYGKPTGCTCSGEKFVGSCECPNNQDLFALTGGYSTCYAICAKPCAQASDCPPAPKSASVHIKCVLGRCLLDCSGYDGICAKEDGSVCFRYRMGPAKGTMCSWSF